MYIPASFAENDQNKLHDFIERHGFGTLVSHDTEPFASHFPLLLERGKGPHGRLVGHMARANPQWKQASGQRVLAIFHGPHVYVSPAWYEAVNVVPTWNYVAVHVYGTFRLQEDAAWLKNVVQRTVETYEGGRDAPWSMETAEPGFLDRMLASIVGFEIDIERIEGKWKLNQNHPAERRERVVRALREIGDENSEQIAELMAANPT